ncbi:Uncharacterized protein Fot_26749 [Forsythia ovata]|uniref:Transmembrane protein n=1 Tax=Forsythia ovata TaxID=205694 RepID=A0ABD1UCQ9_9LAMI
MTNETFNSIFSFISLTSKFVGRSNFCWPSVLGIEKSTNAQDLSAVLSEDKCENKAIGNELDGIDGNGINGSGEIEKRCVGWWKMPVELFKYCIFRVSPLWTVSMAAAVTGFVILGRRLYKEED